MTGGEAGSGRATPWKEGAGSRQSPPPLILTSLTCFWEASGRRPSGGQALPSVASVRPGAQGIAGPPIASIATAPASVYRSAYVMPARDVGDSVEPKVGMG